MRPRSLRSIVSLVLCGLALTALAPAASHAAELPSNATLDLPDAERPHAGWSTMVVVTSATEDNVDVSVIAEMSVQRGAAAITVTLPQGAGEEICNSLVTAVLNFLENDTRFDARRVVLSGYGDCAYQILVLGNRHPDRIAGILAISPRGSAALPTMWGGFRSPQSLYMLASSQDPRATLDLADNAAGQWSAAGERVELRKHDGDTISARDFRGELDLALDWLLMVGGC
jgi:predicted esterase